MCLCCCCDQHHLSETSHKYSCTERTQTCLAICSCRHQSCSGDRHVQSPKDKQVRAQQPPETLQTGHNTLLSTEHAEAPRPHSQIIERTSDRASLPKNLVSRQTLADRPSETAPHDQIRSAQLTSREKQPRQSPLPLSSNSVNLTNPSASPAVPDSPRLESLSAYYPTLYIPKKRTSGRRQHDDSNMAVASPVRSVNGGIRQSLGLSGSFRASLDGETASNGGAVQHSRRISHRHQSSLSGSAAKMSETVALLRRRCAAELGAAKAKSVVSSYDRLIEWISTARLRRLPTEGSAWDKVLAWAQAFAEKFNDFDLAVEQFTGSNFDGAEIAFGYCVLLLELGEDNAAALQTSFGFFFKCSLDLIALLDRVELFNASSDITDQLVLGYADLVTLVSDISLRFYQAIGDTSGVSASIDIYTSFSTTIDSFHSRRDSIVESMWKYQLSQENFNIESVTSVHTLRSWLAVHDQILKYKSGDHTTLVNDRQQLTCLWLQSYLTRFLNGNKSALSIAGSPGSGKSVLAGTIVDTLQRSSARRSYTVVFVPISARVQSQATGIHVVRSLLSQFFEARVGNVQLYKILVDAYETASRTTDLQTYETILWTALGRAIAATIPAGKDTIIVVDGLDEISGPSEASQVVYKNLTDAVSKHEKVRLISLSDVHTLGSKPTPDIEITPDLVYDDIFAVVSHLVSNHPTLASLPSINRDILISQIVTASNGSFLYAKLITKRLLLESSPDKFTKTVEALSKSPKSIQDVIKDNLATAELSEEGKQLLVWLTISQRPLTMEELATLYSIDTKQGVKTDKTVDVLRALRPIQSLVYLQDGVFNLRHGVIRTTLTTHFSQQKTERKPSLDLSLRLLAYLKTAVRDHHEPQFKLLTTHQVDRVLNQDPLAEYAIRYWTVHFSETPFSTIESSKDILTDLAKVSPTSPTVPLLEQSCWFWQPVSLQITWRRLTTETRRKVFGNDHPSVLQSTILLAAIYRSTDSLEPALNYFYQAWQISVRVFSKTHPLTTQCANHYLEITKTITVTSRTEVVSRREEILVFLIEVFKAQYGATSEQVISLRTQLYELYKAVKEEQKATELYKTIYGTSEETTTDTVTSRGTTGSLGVKVKRQSTGSVINYEEWTFTDEKDDLIQLDGSKRVSELLELAKTYAAKGQTARAEQTYFEAWSIISQQSRTNRSIDIETEKISAAVTIANFLKTTKRESEASAILTGVWQEYQSSSVARSEQVTSRLVEVGKFLQTMNVSSVALDIFRYASQYYKSTNKQESSSYKEIEEHLHQSQQEVLKQASSSSASATQLSESVMTEITTVLQSSKTTKLDLTSINAVKQIVASYIAQARYKEATTTIKQALRIIWPTFFSPSPEDVGQPVSNPEFAFDIAERLITTYHARHRPSKTQDYRERLYRAVKSVRKIDDSLVQHNIKELFKIYDWNKDNDKITQLHQELLEDYKKTYGPTHPETIKTLFILARLTSPSPISTEYYRQIVSILTKDAETVHPDALEPLTIIAETYWNERRPQDTTWAYTLLFRTFIVKGKDLKAFNNPDFVLKIYNRLVSSLRSTFVDITIIHKRTTEYRQATINVFGATHQTAVQATVILARLCSSTRRYQSEAISLYELLLKDTHASAYHVEIKAALEAIYEEQALEAAKTVSTTISTEQADRAVSIIRQRITKSRSEHGWASEESLERMQEITSIYARQQKYEAVSKEINETTKQIITKETSSSSLMKGASSVAAAFISTNQTSRGIEMAEELRWQLITKDTSNIKKYDIDVTSSGRSAAIYIAQLEHSLRKDSSVTFAELYISILTEIVYYEEFQQYIRTGQSIENVLSIAARFYSFLALRQRLVMLRHVEDELVSYFIRTSGEKAKVGDVAQVKVLVLTMLEYLQSHQTKNFVRSVSIASIERVRYLVKINQHKQACDLAQTAFRYVHAHGGYATPAGVKQGLSLALAVADLEKGHRIGDKSLRQSVVQVSGTILREVLKNANELSMSWSGLPVSYLNDILLILGEEKDYVTLESILSLLWTARETHHEWKAATVLALGHRLIITRFLIGKHEAAIHLATDIAYNLRRVHGATHLATLDTNVLLSQLLVSTGLAFQAQKGAEQIAKRYFKRAVDVHESVLRSLTLDPLGLNDEDDTTVLSVDPEPIDVSMIVDKDATTGTYARKHLSLLKLALERYGGYPKGYGEYENLNADIFRAYPEELKGIEGVEKWDVKKYGSGKAESDEGTLNTQIGHWALSDATTVSSTQTISNGHSHANGASFNSSATANGQFHAHPNGHRAAVAYA